MNAENKAKPKTGWLNILVDYGPLIIFLAVYKFAAPEGNNAVGEVAAVIKSTLAFMVAAVVALAFSKWKFGKVSPMLWLSTALIVVFGGITVWTGDQRVIQAKPTVLYVVFAALLLIGYWRGKAMLQVLLEAAFEGVDEQGWLKLSRNWGLFFMVLAALNEALVHTLTFQDWLWAKLWVFMPLSFLFTFTQLPMLLRHGLALDDKDAVIKDQPPTD